jgi:hypothetical protein
MWSWILSDCGNSSNQVVEAITLTIMYHYQSNIFRTQIVSCIYRYWSSLTASPMQTLSNLYSIIHHNPNLHPLPPLEYFHVNFAFNIVAICFSCINKVNVIASFQMVFYICMLCMSLSPYWFHFGRKLPIFLHEITDHKLIGVSIYLLHVSIKY